jgi:predicted Zn-dependent protease
MVAVANVLAVRIEETLRPVIGTVLATVSVDVEAKRIGKTIETVERVDLPVIADNLVNALRLVVGQDLAEAAASKVRELA